MSHPAKASRLLLGSCPDSWGVWFPDDPLQTPWPRFLDGLSAVGYQYLKLGPYGYLPTDPQQLKDEVAARGLTIAGGTVAGFSGLHSAEEFGSVLEATRQVAELTAAVGPARHLRAGAPLSRRQDRRLRRAGRAGCRGLADDDYGGQRNRQADRG